MDRYTLVLQGENLDELIRLAQRAEAAGFETLWAQEMYRSSFVQVAALATQTSRINLGTGIALAFTRSPLITALSALDLDSFTRGRFILGLGSNVRNTIEKFHGVPYGKPALRMKEFILLTRQIIENIHTGRPIVFEGQYYNVEIKGFRRPYAPHRERIPIHLAAIQERMVRTAAEVADGLITQPMCSLRWIKEVTIPNIAQGLAAAGRRREEFDFCASICCAIAKNRKQARRAAATTVASYALVRTYASLMAMYGFEPKAEEIRAASQRGDKDAMIDAVTDDMVEAFTVAGTPDEVRRKVGEYRGFVDSLRFVPPHYFLSAGEVAEHQAAILETFGQ
ncbi:MAG: LLM class flavin-dependent oxidoreductase [Chloroflexi bacterium]|nr:LLM class flavin-dependent oxidoreductase [Chloroflexota bacterium]